MNKSSLFTKCILTLSIAASVLSSKKELLHRNGGSSIMSMRGSHAYGSKSVPPTEVTYKTQKRKGRSPWSLGWIAMAFKINWPLD